MAIVPGAPPSLLAPNQTGVMVEQTDWDNLLTFAFQVSGYAIALSQGVANGIPPSQNLGCTALGGMVIGLGPTGANANYALITGILCASTSQQQFTVPSNGSGQTRVDAVCVQFAQMQGSTVSRPVQGGGSQEIPYNYAGIAFQYVEGTPGSGAPSAPSGWVIFAEITVPSGASSITNGDIAIEFPTIDPTGPQGPTGPAGIGNTTLTAGVTIPDFGASCTLDVAATAAFPVGANGMAISGDSSCAMYFEVTAVGSGTLTVTNIGAVPGYANTGHMTTGGTVGFGNQLGYTYITAQINLPAAGATAVGTPVSSYGNWSPGQQGVMVGIDNSCAFLFEVIDLGTNGPGTMDIYCVAPILGNVGSGMAVGSILYPLGNLEVSFQDGNLLGYASGFPATAPIKYKLTGKVSSVNNGNPKTVTFPTLSGGANIFQGANYYRITGLTGLGPFFAYAPEADKLATGFTIATTDATGGDVEWAVEGYGVIAT